MPETRSHALTRAAKLCFPKSNVVCINNCGCFIAPRGVESLTAKKAYAELRCEGKSKETAAKLAHSIDEKRK